MQDFQLPVWTLAETRTQYQNVKSVKSEIQIQMTRPYIHAQI